MKISQVALNKLNKADANHVEDKSHAMASNGIKNAELPVCLGLVSLQCKTVIACDSQSWIAIVEHVLREAIVAGAPNAWRTQIHDTLNSISLITVAEVVQFHSSKETEEEDFKWKLGEIIRSLH